MGSRTLEIKGEKEKKEKKKGAIPTPKCCTKNKYTVFQLVLKPVHMPLLSHGWGHPWDCTLVVQKGQPLKPFTGVRGNIGKDLSKDSALKDLLEDPINSLLDLFFFHAQC